MSRSSSRPPTSKQRSLIRQLKDFGGKFSVDLSSRVAYDPVFAHRVSFAKSSFWGLVDRGILEQAAPGEYRLTAKAMEV